MRTVSDFKNFIKERLGLEESVEFAWRSDKHRKFFEKLNRLGGKNVRLLLTQKVPDIDATVTLTDEEWEQLEAEFRQLLREEEK